MTIERDYVKVWRFEHHESGMGPYENRVFVSVARDLTEEYWTRRVVRRQPSHFCEGGDMRRHYSKKLEGREYHKATHLLYGFSSREAKNMWFSMREQVNMIKAGYVLMVVLVPRDSVIIGSRSGQCVYDPLAVL
jgi:hypothetical protein